MNKRTACDTFLSSHKGTEVKVRLPEGQEYKGVLQDYDDWCLIVDGMMIERGVGVCIVKSK